MPILWREQAEEDLNEVFDYLLDRNANAAIRTRDIILGQIGQLADQPGLGRPGRVTGTRELVIARTSYIVAYLVDPRLNAVVILRILHGARLWPGEL